MFFMLVTEQEFAKIFTTYNKYAYTVCKNTISNRVKKYDFPNDEIGDILQIVFTNLFLYMKKTDKVDNMQSLIAKITELATINYLEKYIRNNDPLVSNFSEEEITILDTISNPVEIVIDSENIGDLISMIKMLDVKYSSVIMLKNFHNLSLKEISDLSGIPYSTICSWHVRGKRLLAKMLLGRGNKNED